MDRGLPEAEPHPGRPLPGEGGGAALRGGHQGKGTKQQRANNKNEGNIWLSGTNGQGIWWIASAVFRGNHLSNATDLTQAFFKAGESYGKIRRSLTRQNTRKTNEAALDK